MSAGEVKNNNQLAAGASQAGRGLQEGVDNHMTRMAGHFKQREHVADDEGNGEEGKGSKGNGDGNEGARQQRGQGWQGPWHWQQGWCATKKARAARASRAMVTRVAGEQQQQCEQWQWQQVGR